MGLWDYEKIGGKEILSLLFLCWVFMFLVGFIMVKRNIIGKEVRCTFLVFYIVGFVGRVWGFGGYGIFG